MIRTDDVCRESTYIKFLWELNNFDILKFHQVQFSRLLLRYFRLGIIYTNFKRSYALLCKDFYCLDFQSNPRKNTFFLFTPGYIRR